MAAYGAEIKQGKTPAQAQAYLSQLLKNAVAQPAVPAPPCRLPRREGDVLLDYEDDAIYAKARASRSTSSPQQTILIQNPIAVTKTASPAAKAFVTYLVAAGQKIWASRATGRSCVGAAQSTSRSPRALHHRHAGRLDLGQHQVLRPDHGHRGQGRAVARRLHRQRVEGDDHRRAASEARQRRTGDPRAGQGTRLDGQVAPSPARPGGPAHRADGRAGARRHLPVAARPPPVGCARHERVPRRVVHFWAAVSSPRRGPRSS